MSNHTTKTCPQCQTEKLLDEFNRMAVGRDGLQSRCKACDGANRREWRAKNPEKVKASKRKYRADNPEKNAAYSRKYHAEHLEENAARCRNRRARKKGNGGSHTAADIKALYALQEGQCWYCGAAVGDGYHVDHYMPLSRGGSNGPENLVIACAPCNLSKHDSHPDDFHRRSAATYLTQNVGL